MSSFTHAPFPFPVQAWFVRKWTDRSLSFLLEIAFIFCCFSNVWRLLKFIYLNLNLLDLRCENDCLGNCYSPCQSQNLYWGKFRSSHYAVRSTSRRSLSGLLFFLIFSPRSRLRHPLLSAESAAPSLCIFSSLVSSWSLFSDLASFLPSPYCSRLA